MSSPSYCTPERRPPHTMPKYQPHGHPSPLSSPSSLFPSTPKSGFLPFASATPEGSFRCRDRAFSDTSPSALLESPYPYASPGSAIILQGRTTPPYVPDPMYRRGHGFIIVDPSGKRTFRIREPRRRKRNPRHYETPISYIRMPKPLREEVKRWVRKGVDGVKRALWKGLVEAVDALDRALKLSLEEPCDGRSGTERRIGLLDFGDGLKTCIGRTGRRGSTGALLHQSKRRKRRNFSCNNAKQPRERKDVAFVASERGGCGGRKNNNDNNNDESVRAAMRSNSEGDKRGRRCNIDYNDVERGEEENDKKMENRRVDGDEIYIKKRKNKENNSNNRSNKENRSNNRSNKENRSNNRSNKEKQRNKLMQMSDRSLKRIYQELRKNQKLHSSGGRGDRREEERRNEDGWIEDGRMERRMKELNIKERR